MRATRMRVDRRLISILAFLSCVSFAVHAPAALGGRASGAVAQTRTSADDEDRMLQPSDVFQNFPELKWGMSFADAKKAIEKTGARPVRASKDDETQLVWVGTFNGMEGRARVYFGEGAGAVDVVVGVYAYDKRKDVFEAWLKKLTDRHGAATEESDNSITISKVWRLKNGFVIELRLLKDDNSPVVDIHWVKG